MCWGSEHTTPNMTVRDENRLPRNMSLWHVVYFELVILRNCRHRSISEKLPFKKEIYGPGSVAHAYNPITLGGRGRWIMRSRDGDHPGQHGETPSLLKIEKIGWARWRVPVIPATQEAEAGELPEPRRRRLR